MKGRISDIEYDQIMHHWNNGDGLTIVEIAKLFDRCKATI